LPLDHLIGAHQHRAGDLDAEQFGGFKIDNQFKFSRVLDRQIAGLYALQNFLNMAGSAPE